MAMNNTPANGDMLADMNTTPLIDVLLVLLVLLLLTLPIQNHAVKLALGLGHPQTPPPPVVNLNVDFDGRISWNGQIVSRDTVDGMFARAARQSPQPEIHVTADRLARYDTVAKVLADAQRLGMTNIGIVNTNAYVQ